MAPDDCTVYCTVDPTILNPVTVAPLFTEILALLTEAGLIPDSESAYVTVTMVVFDAAWEALTVGAATVDVGAVRSETNVNT